MKYLVILSLALALLPGYIAHGQTVHHGYISYQRTTTGSCSFNFDYLYTLRFIVDSDYIAFDSISFDFNEGFPSFSYLTATQPLPNGLKELEYSIDHHFLNCGSYVTNHVSDHIFVDVSNMSGDLNFQTSNVVTYTPIFCNKNSLTFMGLTKMVGVVDEYFEYQFEYFESDGDSLSFDLVEIANQDYSVPVGAEISNDGLFTWNQPSNPGLYVFFANCTEWDVTGVSIGNTFLCFSISIESEVGISNYGIPTFNMRLHPNPATNQLTITTSHPIQAITLTDLTGRVQGAKEDHGSTNTATLGVSNLAKGVYIVGVLTQKGWAMERLVVE